MIHNIFKFNDVEVEDIMTHRTDVFIIDEDTRINDIIDKMLEEGYSRIPVYKDNTDNIVGVLILKDTIPYLHNRKANPKVKDLMKKPLFVPSTRKIDNMLKDFKREMTHMAVVIDEKGGFAGIVTAEDVIEEIVGEMYDETDTIEKKIKKINRTTFMIKGDVEVDSINTKFNLSLGEDEPYETISGYILKKTEKLPKHGQEIKINKGKFIVEIVQNNRIELVKFIKK